MQRVLLIKLPEPTADTQKRCVVPPLGLWSMRTNIQTLSDNWVHVCDMHAGDDLDETLKLTEWDVIGISVQFSIQHDEYMRVAKKAAAVSATVIAGGFHAQVVQPPKGIASVAQGWGEYALAEHLKFAIKGEIQHPRFALTELNRYWEEDKPHDLRSMTNRWIPFETSRGCVRDCAFCGVHNVWKKYTTFSIGWIDTYLKYLEGKGIHELFIEDDNVALQPGRFKQVVSLLNRYNLHWSTPNGIEIRGLSKALEEIVDSGCWRVSLAFETAVEETAKRMNILDKWIKPKDARIVADWLMKNGIEVCGFFIIGWPGESLKQMRDTIAYANSLPLTDRHIYIATPYPGTELYNTCKSKRYLVKDGAKLYRDLRYTKGLIRTKQWGPEQVEELRRKDREKALERRAENV